MKYLELVNGAFTEEHYDKRKSQIPYVAYSIEEDKVIYNIILNYFYIESLEDNNVITLDSTTWVGYDDNKSKLEYSNDTTSWNSMNGVNSITINSGERLYMRCIEGNICKDMYSIPEEELGIVMYTPLFKTSTNCNIGGNINSVMFDYTYETKDCVLSAGAFASLFVGIDMNGESANYIMNASKLELPATTLAPYCYSYMFYGCTSLTTAPKLPATTLAPYCYEYMFYGCTSLTTAPKLPATTLAPYCYEYMFSDCTSLITVPKLPATTLAEYCYYYMFSNCTSLTTAPELPATELARDCYCYMFSNCTSLTTAPELPATELARDCYCYMFRDCTSLTTAPELPATTLDEECYWFMFEGCTSLTTAPELPSTTLVKDCYNGMFSGCTSLTTIPTILPATTLAESCYCNMFSGCTSLTTAPDLPATKLVKSCYQNMFYNCTNLNYIKCLATNTSSSLRCTYRWVNGVSSTGTFVKNPNMASWITGVDGIPSGWTVENATL